MDKIIDKSNRDNINNTNNYKKSIKSNNKPTESKENEEDNESKEPNRLKESNALNGLNGFNGFERSNNLNKHTESKNPAASDFSIDVSYGDLIAETEYWKIFLAPSQRYLGTCVVSLKRELGDLKDLKVEEWADFGSLVEAIELANKKIFNADLFNWNCLKNSAFRKNNPRPHIHWHFIPRYKHPIIFEGLEFVDPDFGYFARAITKKVPKNIRNKLIKLMQDNLDL